MKTVDDIQQRLQERSAGQLRVPLLAKSVLVKDRRAEDIARRATVAHAAGSLEVVAKVGWRCSVLNLECDYRHNAVKYTSKSK